MTEEETAALVMQAIGYAIDGDGERATSVLDTIAESSDNNRMYGVCCAIAAAGAQVLRLLYGSQAPGPGDMWAFSELAPGSLGDPAEAFATRFLVAYANGDTPTCLALYQAALKAGGIEYVDSVCALLANVAGLARLALAEKDARRLPN